MRDLLFLIPIGVGVAIMLVGAKILMPNDSRVRRLIFACCLIVGSICWAIASAINLVWDRTFYIAFDIFTICFFFAGLVCLIPNLKPDPHPSRVAELRRVEIRPTTKRWWLDRVVLMLGFGFLLGVAHCFAMLSETYPKRLIAFYRSLGITATKPKAQPAPNKPGPRPVPTPSPMPKLNPSPPRG